MTAAEMHVLDEAIGLQQLPLPPTRHAHHRAVVPGTRQDAPPDRQTAGEPLHEGVLAEIAQEFGIHSGKKAITASEMPLKMTCMRMGVHSEPVRS